MNEIASKYQISDEFWSKIQPVLLSVCPRNTKGRPRMNDRKALNAIFYILRTGIPWNALPKSLGASSTVHDRFKYYSQEGLFFNLWKQGLIDYDDVVGIDWE